MKKIFTILHTNDMHSAFIAGARCAAHGIRW